MVIIKSSFYRSQVDGSR